MSADSNSCAAVLQEDDPTQLKTVDDLSLESKPQEEPIQPLSKNARKRMRKSKSRDRLREQTGLPPPRKKQKKKVINEKDFSKETSYYFQNGLRKVYPYYFVFSTHAKGRWYKRTLLDVFCKEFKHFPDHVFKKKIESGEVSVNGETVDIDYKLTDNDYIEHASHRHEVPVTKEPIEIVHECENLLVINKPSSIPCHPCGSFRHNSATFILNLELGYTGLKFVHRLDRLTSGLLILAKNETKAAEISRQVASRTVQKEYVCRVQGDFPSGVIACDQPMTILSHKLGIQKVCSSGKEASTTFEKISFNGNTSVVKCCPRTGRTHQIRVHLQYLGFPIINDPLYNSDIWGPKRGKDGDYGKPDEEVISLMLKSHDKLKFVHADLGSIDIPVSDDKNCTKTEQTVTMATSIASESPPEVQSCTSSHNMSDNDSQPVHTVSVHTVSVHTAPVHTEPVHTVSVHPVPGLCVPADSISGPVPTTDKSSTEADLNNDTTESSIEFPADKNFDPDKMTYDPTCLDCLRKFKDPSPEELVMFLHALKYEGPGWKYETKVPAWAQENWEEPH